MTPLVWPECKRLGKRRLQALRLAFWHFKHLLPIHGGLHHHHGGLRLTPRWQATGRLSWERPQMHSYHFLAAPCVPTDRCDSSEAAGELVVVPGAQGIAHTQHDAAAWRLPGASGAAPVPIMVYKGDLSRRLGVVDPSNV